MPTNLSGQSQYRTNTQDLGWEEERAECDEHRETIDEHRVNISDIERGLSAICGMGLVALGLSRRKWTGSLFAMAGGGLLHRAISGYCPAFRMVGIDTSGTTRARQPNDTSRLGRRKVHTERATRMQHAIEINRPPHELYRFWRALDNLPRIMNHLDSVQVINDHLSHWVVKMGPGASGVEWDAEIINEVEDERIGWRSLENSDIDHAGSVEFKPTGNGQRTWLTVRMQYELPGGKLGSTMAAWLGGDPSNTLARDLQRFKEQMETGVLSPIGHRGSR